MLKATLNLNSTQKEIEKKKKINICMYLLKTVIKEIT